MPELIQRLQSGSREAMRELYDRHIRYLTAVAQRYVKDEDVRDVLQESFIKIYGSIDRFEYRGEGSLRAWMARIVANEAISHLRTQGPQQVPLGWEVRAEEDPPTEDVPIEVIHSMIRELPDGYRTVFNLYVFEEYSHREIAQQLGIAEKSSASQLYRAKAILAKKINEYKQKNR